MREFIAIPVFVYYNGMDYNELDKGAQMENRSVLWDKIAGMLESIGLPHVSALEAMMIFAAAFLVLVLILWLVFRNARLWYWKTDIQINTLKSIDGRLHFVEEKLMGASGPILTSIEPPAETEEALEAEDSCGPEEAEPVPEEVTYVGRSGHIYTEAELELQIRD